MPRIVLVQVKGRYSISNSVSIFCSMVLYRFIGVDLARRSLDAGGFMVKMGSFVR